MNILLRASLCCSAFAMASTALAADTTFSQKPFTDVPENSVYFESIEYLRQNNVLKGYSDGTFKPSAHINRAEFVKLIANPFIMDTDRMNQCIQQYDGNTGEKVFFKDVPRDAWYTPEVCYVKDRGIISGYHDGYFRPSNLINFVESAKILSGVFSLQVATEQDPWYKPYVDNLSGKRAIPTSIRSLNAYITRGEMAEMLYRLKANKTTKSSKTASQLY